MFRSARLKLTVWYLLLIAAICILFSVAFYNVASREIQRVIIRMESRRNPLSDGLFFTPRAIAILDPQELQEAENRLILLLTLIDGCIIILSGGLAYILAGKTLQPIQEMVDEQNRFIADASHELRTPLTALRSEMEAALLEKHITSHDAKTLIQSNLEEVEDLQVLAESLLHLAQSPTARINVENVSILQTVEDALKKITPLARKKDIAIQNNIQDAVIQADSREIVELFVILLDNAIKFSPEKSKITLVSKLVDNEIRIEVRDEGIGIAKKDLNHIFDRFYRVDTSRTKNETSGYGLGLSIAKQIVGLYQGSISVKSMPNKGTTFIIVFPEVKE